MTAARADRGATAASVAATVLTGALRLVLLPTLSLVVLFPAAGRLDWWRGWLVGGLFLALFAVNAPLVAWKNPALLRERLKAHQGTEPFDRRFALLYTLGLVAFLLVGGLDAGRFGWSPLPGWTTAVGIGLVALGDVPIVWALMTNPYLETAVRLQRDRGHRVVTTGPYRFVRHPMYTGLLVAFGALPLVLGSLLAFAPIAFMSAVLVWRTRREDATLRRDLEGYEAYAARTRFRLLPGVW